MHRCAYRMKPSADFNSLLQKRPTGLVEVKDEKLRQASRESLELISFRCSNGSETVNIQYLPQSLVVICCIRSPEYSCRWDFVCIVLHHTIEIQKPSDLKSYPWPGDFAYQCPPASICDAPWSEWKHDRSRRVFNAKFATAARPARVRSQTL